MIAETMAGIALVKGAVDGIKSMIGTCNDIGEIAGHIDKLFEGEKQVQQQRNKKSSVSSFDGIGGVATEIIDARLAKEKMQEIATLVDLRFGHGTWKTIVDERAKRIREQKEAAAAARREAIRKQNELIETIRNAIVIVGVISVSILLFIVIAMKV